MQHIKGSRVKSIQELSTLFLQLFSKSQFKIKKFKKKTEEIGKIGINNNHFKKLAHYIS